MYDILVTEADFRTMLSVIRNLKRSNKDLKILAIAQSFSGGLRSKYIDKSIVCNDSYRYLQIISNLAEQDPNLVIFPHLEKTYLYLYENCLKNTIIAPPKHIANKLVKKSEVLEQALRNFSKICPETIIVSYNEIYEIIDSINNFLKSFRKIILKTTIELDRSYGPFNRYVVITRENYNHLLNSDTFINFLKNNKELIIQEYVEGYGLGIGGFWVEGKPIVVGGHRRLLQSHGDEGISLVAESYINTNAMKIALDIMEHFNYTGIGLVEFRLGLDNKLWFMEINPRVWGTLPLYISAGLDIPYIAYMYYTNQKVPKNYKFKFREGIKMFFLKDYVMNNYKTMSIFQISINLFSLSLKAKEGTFDFKDPAPFFYDIIEIVRKGIKKKLKVGKND